SPASLMSGPRPTSTSPTATRRSSPSRSCSAPPTGWRPATWPRRRRSSPTSCAGAARTNPAVRTRARCSPTRPATRPDGSSTRPPVLDVDHVRVLGNRHTAAPDVVRASGVRRGEAMTGVHEGAVAARVRRLPWVERASVRRRWPGTVSIAITERRPAASVRGSGDGWLLVDRTGRLLARVPAAAADVPAIENTPRAGAPGGQLAAVADGALAVAAQV